ncbi:MAG: hypothetical protein CMK82_11260 [Pseudomonadales bacterium]|uniref:hypothetical protein n=1 Tax=Sphingobium sp. TaxID=1912891 RepID=UPI000C66EDCC|nr:hypothetical protein [Sphingobium sp.]MAS67358.1 hypothetical protein [Pseudomonadales bacterium]MBS90853.1 hypothetical protein [Sphingobium sp.]
MEAKHFEKTPFWNKTVNSERDGLPVLFIKNLIHLFGRRIDLHKIVYPDPRECFHSHPARAIRIILWGGYVEEMFDGTHRRWWPGKIGIVRHSDIHRINRLLKERPSYSLWIRGKVRHETQLKGSGWPIELQDTYHRSSET